MLYKSPWKMRNNCYVCSIYINKDTKLPFIEIYVESDKENYNFCIFYLPTNETLAEDTRNRYSQQEAMEASLELTKELLQLEI